jgi:hypothetical protein
VQNGSLVTIGELGQDGLARVELGDREAVLYLNHYRQLDHAYCRDDSREPCGGAGALDPLRSRAARGG